MQIALEEARVAGESGEIPIGAAVFDNNGTLLATAHNRQLAGQDSLAHAELAVLRDAMKKLGSRYLTGCTLVVTLEPCTMCAGAILHARPERVIFGAWDEKAGAAGSVYDVLRDARLPHPEVEVIAGVCEKEAADLLAHFFQERR